MTMIRLAAAIGLLSSPAIGATVDWPVVDPRPTVVYEATFAGAKLFDCILFLGDNLPGKASSLPMCDGSEGDLRRPMEYAWTAPEVIEAMGGVLLDEPGLPYAEIPVTSPPDIGPTNSGGGRVVTPVPVPVPIWIGGGGRPKTPVAEQPATPTPIPLPASGLMLIAGIAMIRRMKR